MVHVNRFGKYAGLWVLKGSCGNYSCAQQDIGGPSFLEFGTACAVTRMSGSIAANFFVVITSDDNAVIITVHTQVSDKGST